MKIYKNILTILLFSIIGYLIVFSFLHYFKVANKYLLSLSGALVFFILGIIYAYFTNKNKDIYLENDNIFKHPFSLKYQKVALREFKKIINLIIVSLLISMMLLCKLIPIPSGFGNLGISLGYLFLGIIGLLFGPYMGMLAGFISDTLGFFYFPPGTPYFFGYTLNAMLSGMIYGIFFYKTKITFTKVLFSRFFVNIFVNSILGTIWWGFLSSFNKEQYLTYFISIALPKNIAYLIPQAIVLFLIFKGTSHLFYNLGYVDEDVKDNITII